MAVEGANAPCKEHANEHDDGAHSVKALASAEGDRGKRYERADEGDLDPGAVEAHPEEDEGHYGEAVPLGDLRGRRTSKDRGIGRCR